MNKEIIIAKNKEHLKFLIKQEIEINGNKCDLNHIDTSHVNNMDNLFLNSDFGGNISQWDTSNVLSMISMFEKSEFNNDISNWNVSNVLSMNDMFSGAKFNKSIKDWDVSIVKEMSGMFQNSSFNKSLKNWDVSSVTNMSYMFADSKFNQDISTWDVRNLKRANCMFKKSFFAGNISNWNVEKLEIAHLMFFNIQVRNYTDFNKWKPYSLIDKESMFTSFINNSNISNEINNNIVIPYWAKAEDIKSAIINKKLADYLNKNFFDKDNEKNIKSQSKFKI